MKYIKENGVKLEEGVLMSPDSSARRLFSLFMLSLVTNSYSMVEELEV